MSMDRDEDAVIQLKREIRELNSDIAHHERIIEKTKLAISFKEKQLWKACEHVWVRDPNCAFDDLVKYYCSQCRLWRKNAWYT